MSEYSPHVLVTGGSGFIASHIIRQLLEHKYTVTATVRTPSKGAALLAALTRYTKTTNQVSYVLLPDITSATAYASILPTLTPPLTHAIHAASPFHFDQTSASPEAAFLRPAIAGTTTLLTALHTHCRHSLRRVVLLSSFAAIRNDAAPTTAASHPPIYDATHWNPITYADAASNPRKAYQGSKTLAERAAWAWLAARRRDGTPPSFDMVAVNPSLVFGPPLQGMLTAADVRAGRLNASNARIWDMMSGGMRDGLAPTGFYSWVDVRDVAGVCVVALEVGRREVAGGGEGEGRCLLIEGWFSNLAVSRVVGTVEGGRYREGLPGGLEEMVEDDLPPVEERYRWDDSRERNVFGVKYRGLEESVGDTVRSLSAILDGSGDDDGDVGGTVERIKVE